MNGMCGVGGIIGEMSLYEALNWIGTRQHCPAVCLVATRLDTDTTPKGLFEFESEIEIGMGIGILKLHNITRALGGEERERERERDLYIRGVLGFSLR
jgi:hypothetical protein